MPIKIATWNINGVRARLDNLVAWLKESNPDIVGLQEIKTIDDALARPDLFPFADDKSKGAVHTCPSGWNCQISTNNAFKAWGAAQKNFALVETGSAAGLDGSIAKAYERRQGWLGYYWAPTAILGKYEMVKLETGVPYDAEAWMNCNTRADCESPKKNDWPRSIVKTVVTDRFKRAEPEAFAYLSVRGWNNETVHGYVVKPHNYEEGKKYPVAFLIHGGPQGSFGNGWSYRWNPQTYAGQGYAVVMIDFHGSTGYGQAFTDAISQHWGDRPLEDLQKGWAAAQQKYAFLDGGKACALGEIGRAHV